MNKKHLFALTVVAGLGFFLWLKKKKAAPGGGRARVPHSGQAVYASSEGPSPDNIPGTAPGLAPLSHFAPLGAMSLDAPEHYLRPAGQANLNFPRRRLHGLGFLGASKANSVALCRAACAESGVSAKGMSACVKQCRQGSMPPSPFTPAQVTPCPSGSVWNGSECARVPPPSQCPAGFVLSMDGTCVISGNPQCPSGSRLDVSAGSPTYGQCVPTAILPAQPAQPAQCPAGFQLTAYGSCVPSTITTCAPGEFFNPINGLCSAGL